MDSPDDEGIYQTIPYDMPMYEVQTVAIEIGPEKVVEEKQDRGFWNETYRSYSSDEDYEHYQSLKEESVYENLNSMQQSGYEVQTLTVEVSETEVVPGEVFSEIGSYEGVSTGVRRKQGIYELPRFQHLFEENDDDDQDNDEDEDCEDARQQDYAEYEDIYDNVFFPEAATEEVKRRTLRISPDETAEDGIFSFENKVNNRGSIVRLHYKVAGKERIVISQDNSNSSFIIRFHPQPSLFPYGLFYFFGVFLS